MANAPRNTTPTAKLPSHPRDRPRAWIRRVPRRPSAPTSDHRLRRDGRGRTRRGHQVAEERDRLVRPVERIDGVAKPPEPSQATSCDSLRQERKQHSAVVAIIAAKDTPKESKIRQVRAPERRVQDDRSRAGDRVAGQRAASTPDDLPATRQPILRRPERDTASPS